MRKVFYCSRCGFTGSDEVEHRPDCPKCDTPLSLTKYTEDEWHAMSEDEKKNAKELIKEQYGGSPEGSELRELISDVKQIRTDVHFLAVVVLVSLIASAILVAIAFL